MLFAIIDTENNLEENVLFGIVGTAPSARSRAFNH